MTLQSTLSDYHDRFIARYGHQLNTDQWSALNALSGCRQGQYGDLLLSCESCPNRTTMPRSCGHRACNQCQYQSTQQWLDRQLQKQLPANYYMATFTLPYELRSLAKAHPKAVYALLMRSATSTLKRFGLNKKSFKPSWGCARYFTPIRVNLITTRMYMLSFLAVACAEPGVSGEKCKGITSLMACEGFALPPTPGRWVVQCQKVGRGKEALHYLSRYLYRGVVSNQNIIENNGTHITFRYRESKTNTWKTRMLLGEAFIVLLLQHVLPKGFRRARDYGFLHGNAKVILRIVQWVLRVERPAVKEKSPVKMDCPHYRWNLL